MIDDADLQKISDKIESDRKARLKKSDRESLILCIGFILGLTVAALIFVLAIETATNNAGYRAQDNIEEEQDKLDTLSCTELKTYSPRHLSNNDVVLEILQRCT